MKVPKVKIERPSQALTLACYLKANYVFWMEAGASLELFFNSDGGLDLIVTSPSKKFSEFLYKEILKIFRHVIYEPPESCEDYQNWKKFLESVNEKRPPPTPGRIRCPAVRTLASVPYGISTMPAVFRFHEEPPYQEIEAKVCPLVKILNKIPGVKTLWSCAGHWDGRPPFVKFLAPFVVARKIFFVIQNTPELRVEWIVKGFLINECPRGGPYISWELTLKKKSGFFFPFLLRKITRDLETISNNLAGLVSRSS